MKNILLLLIVLVLLSACASYKLENKKVKLKDIKNLAYFEPLSYVNLINKDNTISPSDSLSILSKLILDSVINKYQKFNVSNKIIINDAETQLKIYKDLNYMIEKIMHYKDISNIKLSPAIDSVLKLNNQRFALASVITGLSFGHTNTKNYKKRVSDNNLSLDNYDPIPILPISTLFAVIIDAERGEIIFYDHTIPVKKSPTANSVLKNQYHKLFKGYYHK